ncbi:MAG: hypothetical protein AB1489_37245 [Acidobacteriota bacterium]
MLLKNLDDFISYKQAIDKMDNYKWSHCGGDPKQYPCLVFTHSQHAGAGPDIKFHWFIYPDEDKCEHCGHSRPVFHPGPVQEICEMLDYLIGMDSPSCRLSEPALTELLMRMIK